MKYIPAEIPADLSQTRTGILWAAANIAVTEPEFDDAIGEAARRAGVHGTRAMIDAEALAVEVARSRVPLAPVNPAWPASRWRTWQDVLVETWPILADAAGALDEGSVDRRIGLVPGRWVL